INALKDANSLTEKNMYSIFKRMYMITYPHWILDYKDNKALPEAAGLLIGLWPGKNANFKKLSYFNKFRITSIYFLSSSAAFLMPVTIFKRYKLKLYSYFKK
ncbi:MAG TPA: hypothetical protein VF622_02525, partial [Segetibacter sp.]